MKNQIANPPGSLYLGELFDENTTVCINPNNLDCECQTCLDERIKVSGFRNLEIYNNSGNPLAAWMNSDEWTTVGESATKGKRGTWFTENDVYWGNETFGSIQCK